MYNKRLLAIIWTILNGLITDMLFFLFVHYAGFKRLFFVWVAIMNVW
jgi:hypothetical protein